MPFLISAAANLRKRSGFWHHPLACACLEQDLQSVLCVPGGYQFTTYEAIETYTDAELDTLDIRLLPTLAYLQENSGSAAQMTSDLCQTLQIWAHPERIHFDNTTQEWVNWKWLATPAVGVSLRVTRINGSMVHGNPVAMGPEHSTEIQATVAVLEQEHPGITKCMLLSAALGLNICETAQYCHQQLYHPRVEQALDRTDTEVELLEMADATYE